MDTNEKIKLLRQLMKENNIEALYIPTDDYHLSEYVGNYFKQREFLTGFTGSAGSVILTEKDIHLWTDGRYFLQAEQQIKGTEIILERMGEKGVLTPLQFICENKIRNLGINFKVIPASFGKLLAKTINENGGKLFDVDFISQIWKDRPSLSHSLGYEMSLKYVGEKRSAKIKKIQDFISLKKQDLVILSSLDDIMYIYNLRGSDVDYNPVLLSYSVILKDKSILYIQNNTLSKRVINNLKKDNVIIKEYSEIYNDLNEYKNLKIIFDESKNNYALFNSLKNNEITNIDNSEFIKKQIKNKVEIKNIKLAHIKDGVAMCKFIYWLKHDKGFKDELMVSDKLLQFRKEQEGFLYHSFDTICGYAAHGAIVHYSADEKSNIQVKNEGILLVDSGGQYLQGTTDITRSIVMGKVTNKMKRDFTLVLKGHLKLMSAVFKDGTRGSSLDILARGSLWDEFKDFNHGTGHGVGYFLNVHEGPNSIHYNRVNNTEMREGMLTSNEPGIYIANEYGIRHENLILCVKAKENSYGTFLKFKTVTLVPFDLSGINVRLLTKEEKKVLNQYHAEVYKKISPYLSKKEKTWLKLVTKSI